MAQETQQRKYVPFGIGIAGINIGLDFNPGDPKSAEKYLGRFKEWGIAPDGVHRKPGFEV
ncbi:hypothetical protein HYV84_03595 [Candidatus Woesearchaeota archaeon]|nr:hypothetical protein [Candidatus Woesearchaeota archaeon]